MDEIKMDYLDQMNEHRLVGHVCPISKPKEQTSREMKKMDGEVRKEKLPHLITLSSRIKFAMRGKTQAEFAKEIGVSACTVSTWCQGRYEPRSDGLERIAKVGNVPLSWLMGEWPEQNPPEETSANPQEQQEESELPAFFMGINGVYNGEQIGVLLSCLIKDRKYKVSMRVEEGVAE